jgi:hypothetical protein
VDHVGGCRFPLGGTAVPEIGRVEIAPLNFLARAHHNAVADLVPVQCLRNVVQKSGPHRRRERLRGTKDLRHLIIGERERRRRNGLAH